MANQKDTIQLHLYGDSSFDRASGKSNRAPMSEAHRRKIAAARRGRQWSDAAKRKMSESAIGKHDQARNGNWKGGEVSLVCRNVLCAKTFYVRPYRVKEAKYCSKRCRRLDPNKKSTEAKRIRASVEYKAWREMVFIRDDYTCQICHRRGGVELHADHIKPFALFPELRFDVHNGRTLCIDCHSRTDTFGVKTWRRKAFLLEQTEEDFCDTAYFRA